MPRRASADLTAIDQASVAQDGLITAAQLREAGLASSTIALRARTGGLWTRVLPRIYLVSGGRPDPRQRRRAALLYAGPDAVLSGRDALELLGVERPQREPPCPLVLIPHTNRRTSAGFVTIERTRRPPEPVDRDGFAIAPVARAIVDAARRMQRRDDVVALAARAVQGGFTTVDRLEAEVAAAQIRGTALIRDAVRDLAGGARSAPEAELRRAWLEAELPTADWNATLTLRNGEFLARPDAYVSEHGVAVEVDSREHHLSPRDWERTMRRHARMSARGIVVLHYPPSRIRRDLPAVIAEIRSAVAARTGLPQPDLRVVRGAETRSR